VYKGHDLNEGNLFRKIKNCVLNCHTLCSVPCCGSVGKELHFECVDKFGHHQGEFKKVHNGCYNECCSPGDRYEITLPHDEAEAALMLAAVQFMDMLYFEIPLSCCAA
jgi:hypothetical protein